MSVAGVKFVDQDGGICALAWVSERRAVRSTGNIWCVWRNIVR